MAVKTERERERERESTLFVINRFYLTSGAETDNDDYKIIYTVNHHHHHHHHTKL